MMDKDKGWLEEVLRDVNEDVKAWPEWLKDEKPQGEKGREIACGDNDLPHASKTKFD